MWPGVTEELSVFNNFIDKLFTNPTIHPFKVYSSMGFNIVTWLAQPSPSSVFSHFLCPQKQLHTYQQLLPIFSQNPQLRATTYPLSVPGLASPDGSHR